MKGKKTSSLKSPFTKIRKLHENIQITLVNMLTLLCNLMMKIITKSINIFAQRKKDVMFFCYTISGVNKFLSRHQTFRDSILLARSIGHVKNECPKPKCTYNRDTTRNIDFCSLLPKQCLQLSF